ncbi:MAG: response regulator transcription factor [Chloroflexi bacterium]|nr:response regulator transcription factor [Chloroflexota bacterium]
MVATSGRATVLIADDHPMVREGLRSMVAGKDVQVVGEAGSGSEALERVRELQPDVVLMDVRMPDMDGLAATEIIKKEKPETSVVIVTSYESMDYLRRAVIAGAAGYVLKGVSQTALVNAIRIVKSGGSLIDGALLKELLKEIGLEQREPLKLGGLDMLSPRERDVLRHLVRGLTNKEIAQEMHYSVGTVKNAVQRIIEKLGASDRTQAAVLAVQAGIGMEQPAA